MQRNEFPIVFSSDNRGVLPLSVSIYSLLTTAKPGTFYRVYVLSNGIEEGNVEKIKKLASPFECSLEFVNVDDVLKKQNLPHRENLPMATWGRIFIPEILSGESGKILYLDIDILVCKDLAVLFDTDITGKALGVVYECFSCRGVDFHDRLDIPLAYKGYFNAGVLLMNLDVFREKNLSSSIIKYADENMGKLDFLDQDALNAVLYDLVVPMHPRWNWNDKQSKRILWRSPKAPFWNCAPPRQEIEAASDPAILHYLGRDKPWRYNWRYEGKRYEDAMRAAGLLHGSLPGRNFSAMLRKYLSMPLYWLAAKKIAKLKTQFDQ